MTLTLTNQNTKNYSVRTPLNDLRIKFSYTIVSANKNLNFSLSAHDLLMVRHGGHVHGIHYGIHFGP